MSLYPRLNVADGRVLESNAVIFCSFCNEPSQSAEAMKDHLVQCGNKTEPCPTCHKFVRRAIFAYHYENNCADDPDAPNNRNRTPQERRPSNGIRITVTCPFCNQNHEKEESKTHKKVCSLNPINAAQAQKIPVSNKSNTNTGQSSSANGSDDSSLIPCEYCSKGIEWNVYQTHIRDCQDKEYDRMLARVRDTSLGTPSAKNTAQSAMCKFCSKLMSLVGFDFHQRICVRNPRRNNN